MKGGSKKKNQGGGRFSLWKIGTQTKFLQEIEWACRRGRGSSSLREGENLISIGQEATEKSKTKAKIPQERGTKLLLLKSKERRGLSSSRARDRSEFLNREGEI